MAKGTRESSKMTKSRDTASILGLMGLSIEGFGKKINRTAEQFTVRQMVKKGKVNGVKVKKYPGLTRTNEF